MGEARNITLKVDDDILRKARVIAAQRGTSLSRLLADTIREIALRDDAIEASTRSLIEWLDHGPHYSLEGSFSRESLYDRPHLRRQ